MESQPWQQIIELLACPGTFQELKEMSPADLSVLNEQITSGKSFKVNGLPQQVPLQAGLIRADRQVVYPVDGGILVLLEEEGIRWTK